MGWKDDHGGGKDDDGSGAGWPLIAILVGMLAAGCGAALGTVAVGFGLAVALLGGFFVLIGAIGLGLQWRSR